jgi:hypothetical protein
MGRDRRYIAVAVASLVSHVVCDPGRGPAGILGHAQETAACVIAQRGARVAVAGKVTGRSA